MEAGAAAAAAEESGQVHQVTSAFFQQQQQDPGGGQCLMRYHSAPGSLLCSLMPDHSQAANLASAPSTSHLQQQQQHHHHSHLDMNSLSSININMSITSNDHINILHEQQQNHHHHHSQQQPSSSNGSVSLSRMGSIDTPPQYDHQQESYEAVVVPLAFRVQQNELLDHRARPSSTAHHHHHPPPPPPPPHHHHHSFIQQQQPFDHIDQPSPYTSSTDHHQPTDNLAAAFAAPDSCNHILKQTKSSADLLSKLVEGMSSRDQSSVHNNNNVVNSSSLVNVDQHLHLNQPASAAAAVNLVLPLTRSTSDGLSSARVSLPNMNNHGTNSSAAAVCQGNDQTSCGGLWDDGFLSMHDQAAASSGRKRMRDCSEVVEQQRFAEEMAYCDEERCAMEHPALLLSRHLNLRNELQDAVPCKLRARRGCATHPRSVAERVRRTKISEGIKRLHDLVPSMDKQTNTADMLNHAMEYMKQLKEQLEQMQEEMKKCKEKCQGLCSGDSDKPEQ